MPALSAPRHADFLCYNFCNRIIIETEILSGRALGVANYVLE